MPKKPASNSAASCEEAALADVAGARWSGSGSYSRRGPSRGRRGRRRSRRRRRRPGPTGPRASDAAGEAAAHADDGDRLVARRRRAPGRCRRFPRRCPCRRARSSRKRPSRPRRRVVEDAGSRAAAAPVAAASRLRSSTAVSESKPRSWNGRSASTAVGAVVAEDGRGLGRTSSSTTCRARRRRRRRACGRTRRRRRPVRRSESSAPAFRASRTSGRSPSSGLGRAAVKAGANRAQSTSATVTAALRLVDGGWPARRCQLVRHRVQTRGGAGTPWHRRGGHAAARPRRPRRWRWRAGPGRRRCSASASR